MKWLFGLLGAHYCLPPSCKLLLLVVLNQDYACQLGRLILIFKSLVQYYIDAVIVRFALNSCELSGIR